ncbi:MAG: putative chromosome-partitioning protein ParB [Gammaproteobacteria bacterium]|nr:putative chromosome-partitioning protein ParB [Gammaproteobacteria bacterium]
MSSKKRRLGRGLDALLTDPAAMSGDRDGKLFQVPVESLQRGLYQPRTQMNKAALEELAQSIKTRGIVQPIVARDLEDGGYEIIAGERRWRAAQLAGLETVPVVLRTVPDEAALVISLIENIQRENLNPIEEATGLKRLLDEFGLTHERVAHGVGRSRSAVTNILRLLSLGPVARNLLEEGKLEMGHARALLMLSGDEQDTVARTVTSRRLSVRQTEALVKQIQKKVPARKKKKKATVDPDVQRLQEELSERLGAGVTIKYSRGRGQVIIDYHSLEELDGLLSKIR